MWLVAYTCINNAMKFDLQSHIVGDTDGDSVDDTVGVRMRFICREDNRVSLRGMDQKLPFGGINGRDTRIWTLFFATTKSSDYKFYYEMLLEQCGHMPANELVTIIRLDEDNTSVCLVNSLD